jgi:hypothetical protein
MARDQRNTSEGGMNEGDDTARKNDRGQDQSSDDSGMKAGGRSEDSTGTRGTSADDLDGSLRAQRDQNHGEVY